MIVVDNKKNVYDVRFYDTNFAEWSEEFFNTGNWNTIELDDLGGYIAYECEMDINALIDYMNDFLNKEGEFVEDETEVVEAYYRIRYMFKLEK